MMTSRVIFFNEDSTGLPVSGATLWLDASDANTIIESGGDISRWDDKSGNGYNAVQLTGANQPTYETAVLNDNSIVRFNGSSQYMTIGTSLLESLSNIGGVTIFIVSITTTVQNSAILRAYPTDSPTLSAVFPWGDSMFYFDWGNFGGDHRVSGAWGGSTDTPYIWTMLTDGTTRQAVFRDGTNLIEDTDATQPDFSTTREMDVGAGNRTNFFDGDVAEVIIYPSTLSSGEIDLVETYLANKWGITL